MKLNSDESSDSSESNAAPRLGGVNIVFVLGVAGGGRGNKLLVREVAESLDTAFEAFDGLLGAGRVC